MSAASFEVFLEDVDALGIVYHSRYLQFLERARVIFFRDLGVDHHAMISDSKKAFVVSKMAIDFIKPAFLSETLTVRSQILKVGMASMICQQEIFVDKECSNRLIMSAEVKLALIDLLTYKPVQLPQDIVQKIQFSKNTIYRIIK